MGVPSIAYHYKMIKRRKKKENEQPKRDIKDMSLADSIWCLIVNVIKCIVCIAILIFLLFW